MNDYFIDIGNTRIKYTKNQQPYLIQYIEHNNIDELIKTIVHHKVQRLFFACGHSKHSQRALSHISSRALSHNIETLMIKPDDMMLKTNYTNSTQFGTDRFLNLLAARSKFNTNFCVVSAGTAITLDFFTSKHVGGMILLGLGQHRHVLAEKTGLNNITKPDFLLGNDTQTSIGAGIYFGLQNLIVESIDRISKEYNDTSFSLVWTGGDAESLYSGQGSIMDNLLFEGMHIYLSQKNLNQ